MSAPSMPPTPSAQGGNPPASSGRMIRTGLLWTTFASLVVVIITYLQVNPLLLMDRPAGFELPGDYGSTLPDLTDTQLSYHPGKNPVHVVTVFYATDRARRADPTVDWPNALTIGIPFLVVVALAWWLSVTRFYVLKCKGIACGKIVVSLIAVVGGVGLL